MQQIERAERAADRTSPAEQIQQQTELAISVVVPVFNEEESLRPLHEALSTALQRNGQSYEIIFVDDGSRDGSFTTLQAP